MQSQFVICRFPFESYALNQHIPEWIDGNRLGNGVPIPTATVYRFENWNSAFRHSDALNRVVPTLSRLFFVVSEVQSRTQECFACKFHCEAHMAKKTASDILIATLIESGFEYALTEDRIREVV